MFKAFLILLALIPTSIFASIITHSETELANTHYIFSMSNQQYGQQYQNVMFLMQNGELDEAKKALAYLLTQNPYDITALDISGNILLEEKKIPQAINAFQRVLSSKQSPDIMAKLGVSYLLIEDIKNAKLWLTQSLSLSPNNELALRYLAWIEEKSLNQSMQFHYISQLVKLSYNKKSLYEYHLQYLTLLVENNNITAGLDFIDNNREKLATSADIITKNIKLIEIELLLKANKLSLAKDKFKQYAVPKKESDNATNYSLLSVFYYASLKDYKKAESIINNQLSTNNAAKSIAEYSFAKVYFDHGNYQAAHNKLISLLNNESQLYNKMNYIDDIVANYSAQSRYSDAIKFLKEQIEQKPEIPQFQHQLAELYILSGRTKAANTQLESVIANFPDYIPSYIVKARQLTKQKDQQAIIDFFKLALDKHPQVAELWIDYAAFHFNNNQPEQSLLILEKAVSANKGNPQLTFELAAMYDNQNLRNKSEPLYLKVLQNYPEYLPALDNLATNYFMLNKHLANAAVLAKRAFLLAPNDPFIINLRAQAHIYDQENQQAIDLIMPVLDKFQNSGLGYLSLAKAYRAIENESLAKDYLIKALENDLPTAYKEQALKIKSSL
ncbi:tetratricopeptide repeat protein [Thalassotalea piscium]|uniref:Putative Zn-dependent protease n=1 Tax=Thalassotalea piscium TaxID=1230533 RepID=A0A7X0TTZ6_9GAMM|nr:tetratricopeptide repeat protein [Thalassotalea piscium]MBB6543781.1 putative Zn-dependent protease [Thalassotalea piscium]